MSASGEARASGETTAAGSGETTAAGSGEATAAGGPFARRTLTWLLIIGVGSLAGALLMSVFAADLGGPPVTAGPSAYSRSATGHAALVELLRRLDIPVVVSQHGSARKAGWRAVLVVAEPGRGDQLGARLREMLDEAQTMLLVLPKWRGTADPRKPGWLAEAELLPEDEVQAVLRALDIEVALHRSGAPVAAWDSPFGTPSLIAPQLLEAGDVLEPVVSSSQGTLLGLIETYQGTLWVLSDPDLLSNHGLGRGDNARLVVAMLDALREEQGAVVVDETLHGFQVEPGIWRELFTFPLILPTIQVFLTVLALLGAATLRFGAPRPRPPAIAPGKGFLIDNTAALLHHGGHGAHTLQRYLQGTVREVARALHAPLGLAGGRLEDWLARVGRIRRVDIELGALRAEVDALAAAPGRPGDREHTRRLIAAAGRLYRWRQEMIHGPSNRQAD